MTFIEKCFTALLTLSLFVLVVINIGGIIGGAIAGQPFNPRPFLSYVIKYFRNIPSEANNPSSSASIDKVVQQTTNDFQKDARSVIEQLPDNPRTAACPKGALMKNANIQMVPVEQAKKYPSIIKENNVDSWNTVLSDLGSPHCEWNNGTANYKVYLDDDNGFLKIRKQDNNMTANYYNLKNGI